MPGGRPRIKIDWDRVDECAKIQCTHEEVAAICKCSVETLERRAKEELDRSFAEYFAEKRQLGRESLRRRQYKTATEDNNPTMQIWLGKNWLNQSDKREYKQEIKDSRKLEDIPTEELLSILEDRGGDDG